jgi:hypothetical protein
LEDVISVNARGCQDHEERAVSKVASLSALKSVEAADTQMVEIVVVSQPAPLVLNVLERM